MGGILKRKDDILAYIEDQEYIANLYVMKCFSVTMLVYLLAFILNILNVFIIDQTLMISGFIPSAVIYALIYFIAKKISFSNSKIKYFILFGEVVTITIMGVTITYHVVFGILLPFLCAALYSSKKVMNYVYTLSVISTVIIVYGGYYFGLCDANMALLTTGRLRDYVVDGQFTLTQVNENPALTLMLFFVIPRCLIYIAFVNISNSIITIVSGSLEKAKLTAELEKAKQEAENANKAKSQFLARMSHEIRTPINAIFGMNEMIIQESEKESIKRYASDVKDSSEVLLNIINEILDSSKIESGKMEIIPQNYQIGSLLNDLYNMIRLRAKSKSLELIFDVDETMPCEYYGDDKRIRQVILNLLTNAVKYTEKGTVTFKVSWRREGENAIITYSVKDTGIGIKPENINKIYDAFARFDESRNRNIEGTGLGMNIANQLLRLMGSELQIQSEYEKGSEFSFDIEQKIVNYEALGDFKKSFAKDAEKKKRGISILLPNVRVLSVDDNAMNLKVFKGLLKQTQMQITEAMSGQACLDILKEQSFDIIFLDHMMPGMDGVETLHAMKENHLCDNVPVIMLTANAIIGERERFLAEGFDGFLSKPIAPDKLEQIFLDYLPKALLEPEKEEPEDTEMPEDDAKSEQKLTIQEPDEFDFSYAMGLLQKEELLKQVLAEFRDSMEPLGQKLSELFEAIHQEDVLHSYRLEVHALKSTSATVGAMMLSQLARLLEIAAAEGDIDRIQKLHPILIDEMKKHADRVADVLPRESKKASAERVEAAYLDMLSVGLQNGDYNTADFVCAEIQKYQYPDKIQKLVDTLAEKVLNLKAGDALAIIEEIKVL